MDKIKADLTEIRNSLYDNLPTGSVGSFDLITIIKEHLDKLDKFIDSIHALSTQSPKWVSVEDDLPEVGEYVLVYNTEGATLVARCLMNGWAAFFADGEKLMGELKATHWMPLPSSPNSEPPSSTHPLQEKIDGFGKLFGYLAEYGGKIVCSNELSPEWINQARASGRMYVDDNSIGYVWEPDIKKFPETEEELLFLEKWYPLKFELPENLKTFDWLHKPINKQP